MFRFGLCLLLAVFLNSCGLSKKTLLTPLVNPVKEYESKAFQDSIGNVKPSAPEEIGTMIQPGSSVDTLLEELTDQDTLQLLKKRGMYTRADFTPAMHFDLRKPNYVIIHHTSQNSTAQTIRTFQLPHTKVSSHYVIGKDGQVIQLLNDYERAWHAGKSKWGSLTDINSASIGIELDNNGRDSFPDVQINSLLVLLDTLKGKYLIPELNFIGHADIAPSRKNDPNVTFPWKRLAKHGFGIWYNDDFQIDPPVNFNPIDALKVMGYDMRNPEAAIEAFKRKFIVKEVNKVLTAYDIKILYDLYRKYY